MLDAQQNHHKIDPAQPVTADIADGHADRQPDSVATALGFFTELARPQEMFDRFRAAVPEKNLARARTIGSLWYHLSEAIVDVLCLAMAKLENNRIRHFVNQTLYEELGESSEGNIHTDLLRDSLRCAGITDNDILFWSGHAETNQAIDSLLENLDSCTSDAEICGLLLGMEVIAYENVGNVVDYVSYSDEIGKMFAATTWVRLHNQLEEAHIRRAVGVYVQNFTEQTAQRKFVKKFSQTIAFWERFWGSIATAAA